MTVYLHDDFIKEITLFYMVILIILFRTHLVICNIFSTFICTNQYMVSMTDNDDFVINFFLFCSCLYIN